MGKRIMHELKVHAPFTALGALSGIVVVVVIALVGATHRVPESVFHTLHPAHVFLSAIATTAVYRRYGKGRIWAAVLVGWTGAIGIGTVSDALMPYLGGTLLGAEMEFHVPFIEEWWISLVALAGVGISLWKQKTKIPHFGHVLLSTWASLFYLITYGEANWLPLLPFIFLILFLAVWIPCCMSDIVYPLLFVGRDHEPSMTEMHDVAH
ncbi:MAG: hypothetical protein ACNA7X_05585 [Dehalococcoidia bacterium]